MPSQLDAFLLQESNNTHMNMDMVEEMKHVPIDDR